MKRSETFGAKFVDFPAATAGATQSELAENGGRLVELTFLPKLDLKPH